MADADELSSLRETVEALRREVRSLRDEIDDLKVVGRAFAETPKPVPAPAPKPGPLEAPKPVEGKRACRHCGQLNELQRDICWACYMPVKSAPAAAKPPLPAKPVSVAELVSTPKAAAPAAASWSLPPISMEQFVGERLLHYVGLVVLAIGVLFFLIWQATHAGPGTRVAMSAATGAALIGLGVWFQTKPPYDKLANGITAGGWSILYLTAFAAYHLDATKIIADPSAELIALCLVGIGMVAHALSTRSQGFRLFAFGLSYFVLFLSGKEVKSFEMFLVLSAFSALIAVEMGHADILVVSMAGFYLNYTTVFVRVIHSPLAGRGFAGFIEPFSWLAGGYLILAVLPLVPRVRAKLFVPEEESVFDGALCLNALAFSIMAIAMAASYFPHPDIKRSVNLSLFLALPGFAYLFVLPRKFQSGSLTAILGLLMLAAGIAGMPSPLWKMFAWIVAASLWVWIGLVFDHKAWRVSGLLMAVLTFAFFFHVARISALDRRAAAMAMFGFAVLSYLASRFYRVWLKGELTDWERPVMEYWLYVGSAALILGLWGVLEPSALAVVLIALAILGEFAAVYFGRVHLWGQASALSVAVGAYTFFIDFGPNTELFFLGLTPRILTAGCVAAGMAYLYYADPTPKEFTKDWTSWTHAGQRSALSWTLLAVLSFAVYHEVNPRSRLPFWALAAALTYYLGRSREEENLKYQGAFLAIATGVEGAFSYLLYPKALLAAPSAVDMAMYWGSAGVLLFNLFVAKDKSRPRTDTDIQAGWAFAALAMGMIGFYLAKELESYYLTVALAGEGFIFLVAGMAFNALELRYPALLLLGLCVVKALLIDTSRLPLPQRVATFIGLGIALIVASMLYVQLGKNDEKDPSSGPR